VKGAKTERGAPRTSGDALGPLDALLEHVVDLLAARLIERMRDGVPRDTVSQADSPLGRRRHIAAVRRRIECGAPGAYRTGRRYLLSRSALEEELQRASGASSTRSTAQDVRAELQRKLRLVRDAER
jgi:hypothetical protein